MEHSKIIIPISENRSFLKSVGGKAYTLGLLYRDFFKHIPYGFSISAAVLDDIICSNTAHDEKSITVFLEDNLKHELQTHVQESKYYAVRSSAIDEDGSKYSFAGQFSSFLGVRGYHNVLESISRCIISRFSKRVNEYRRLSRRDDSHGFSVFIQEMIKASKSGILFTRNPVDGSNELIIEAAYGLGDLIVEGRVSPDNIKILSTGEIVYTKNSKQFSNIITESGLKKIAVSQEMRSSRVLSEREIEVLANLGTMVEKTLSYPVDIEWSISYGKVFILQVRRITSERKSS